MKKSDIKYILNISLRLLVICAFIALLVASVNFVTKPVIERNDALAQAKAIEELFSEEISYTDLCIPEKDLLESVKSVFEVKNSENERIGFCVKISPSGFKGNVDLLVAVSSDLSVSGVKVTATNDETVGIGTKVADKEFTEKFIGLSEEITSKNISDYIIAGATKTSKPVSAAISNALMQVKSFVREENS